MGALSGLRRPGLGRVGGELLGKLFVVALVPIVFYSLAVVAEKFVQTYRLRQDAIMLRAEIEAERRDNIRLQIELAHARSDQGIEDAARRHLNLVRAGDQPVVLSGMPVPTPTLTPSAQARPGEPDPSDDLIEWASRLLAGLGR